MIDREDGQLILRGLVLLVTAMLLILAVSGTLALAIRLFELIHSL